MQAIDVINQLTIAPSRVAKEAIILDAYLHNCSEFFEAVRLATDPFIPYGITSVAKISETNVDDGVYTLSFSEFCALCKRLHGREFATDSLARQAIHDAAERCHTITWNVLYRRILLKSLEMVDATLINRVLKRLGNDADRFRVPLFRCQMATLAPDRSIIGPHLVDVKLKGLRLLAVLESGVFLYNSVGAVSNTHPELERALQPLAAQSPVAMVFDGVVDHSGIYTLFDLIPLADFRLGHCRKPQHQRRMMLELLQRSGAFDVRFIRVLPQISINFGTTEAETVFDEFSKQALASNIDTVVIKKPHAPYIGKRTTAWLLKKIV